MDVIENKNAPTIVVLHWKNKFEKSIKVLLKHGYHVDELIEKIKEISNEKNN